MPVTAIVGAQWGDEGKGKIIDLLAQDAGMVIRFNGGSNAGHTVVNEYGEFKLHLIPSGIFNREAISLVGTGTVVDFDVITEEMDQLARAQVPATGLRISSRAQVVMPYHLLLDRLQDEARGKDAIGTTRRGVGPAYVDKADRVGIQTGDLLDPAVFERKLSLLVPLKNRTLREIFGHPGLSLDDLLAAGARWRDRFGAIIVEHLPLVTEALKNNRRILLEGQLGALRDLDWGIYPYVTSSTTISGGGAVGGGIPPGRIERVIGVVKAYTSAVGAGPLPAELHGDEGEELRRLGAEFGTVTGRPRRVGWFDAVATRYACLLNGFSSIAVTKLDVLDTMARLQICVGYRCGTDVFDTVPSTSMMEKAEPIYEEMPGWLCSTSNAKNWDDLPPAAQSYLKRIEALVQAPVGIISVGKARDETVVASRSAGLLA